MNRNWRRTKEYKHWRNSVIEGKVCIVCKTKDDLHAHHLNHASYFPDERFDVKNGVALCSSCHSNFHNNYHRSTRVKCTKYSFANCLSFLEKHQANIKKQQNLCTKDD